MIIEISKEARKEAITSIERYFQENMEARIGYETVFYVLTQCMAVKPQ